jgi:hypothetical protein
LLLFFLRSLFCLVALHSVQMAAGFVTVPWTVVRSVVPTRKVQAALQRTRIS